MPFDSSDYLSVFTPGLTGLKKLSQLLRQEMPRGFVWYFLQYKITLPELEGIRAEFRSYERHYGNLDARMRESGCGTAGCAIGLATTVWPELSDMLVSKPDFCKHGLVPDMHKVASYFGITETEAYGLFFDVASYDVKEVTPQMVADKIDALLERKILEEEFVTAAR